MPTITGTLVDARLGSLSVDNPQIIFTISGPATSSPYLITTKRIVVIPAPSGEFTVELTATADMSPDRWYNVRIVSLNPANGYVDVDFLEWELRVPVEGGDFADLVTRPLGPGEIWVSSDTADPPGSQRGDFIFDPTTNDIDQIV